MSVFVINEDQIKKIILAFVAAVVTSFLLGYLTGAGNPFKSDDSDQFDKTQKTEISEGNGVTKDQASAALKTGKTDALKDKNITSKEVTDKKAAEKKTADKNAEKKRISEKKKAAEKKKSEKKAAEKEKSEKKVAEKKLAEKKKIEKKAAEKKSEEARKQAAIKKAESKKQAEKEAPLNKSGVEGEAENSKVDGVSGAQFYSIQAGMFASETNADSFIKKLSEKQFDAYVSSFVSSSGATKYNVRVGKFEKRDQARDLLKDFQKSFSSPAYVVITQ